MLEPVLLTPLSAFAWDSRCRPPAATAGESLCVVIVTAPVAARARAAAPTSMGAEGSPGRSFLRLPAWADRATRWRVSASRSALRSTPGPALTALRRPGWEEVGPSA